LDKLKLSVDNFSWALRLSFTVSLAFFLASNLKLDFAAAAGIIGMLASITLRNKEKLLPSIIEWYASITIGSVLIFIHELLNYTIFVLFLMLFIYFSILLILNLTECMVIGAVIVTHYFGVANLTFEMIKNEFMLVTIGILIAAGITCIVNTYNKSLKNN
jgi:Predicted membrane protein